MDNVLSEELLPVYLGGDLALSSLGAVFVVVDGVVLLSFVMEALPPYFEAILSMVLGVSDGSRLVDLA